ncbi:MAG: hypothetical protein ACON4R_15110 [Akkermansiaceae bacterium]
MENDDDSLSATRQIALKLYAGGLKFKSDIIKLIIRNPEVNLQEIGDLCSYYWPRGI